jgi:hypothetical protein
MEATGTNLTTDEAKSVERVLNALDAEIDAGTGMDSVWREWRAALTELRDDDA